MTSKQALYDNYVASGQAGVDPAAAHSSAQAKLAKGNPYLERLIKRHFPANRNSRILDLGCGHGGLLMLLKKHGYRNLAGVDTSPAQVALAHELGLSEIQQGDALEFLDEQSPADVICCFDLLEHLTRDECSTLVATIAGKLTPGGNTFIACPQWRRPLRPADSLRRPYPRNLLHSPFHPPVAHTARLYRHSLPRRQAHSPRTCLHAPPGHLGTRHPLVSLFACRRDGEHQIRALTKHARRREKIAHRKP